jgi:secreted Zn-dependent insulinase-like peptidase
MIITSKNARNSQKLNFLGKALENYYLSEFYEKLYDAIMLNYNIEVATQFSGLQLTLFGFKDKMKEFTEEIIRSLIDMTLIQNK